MMRIPWLKSYFDYLTRNAGIEYKKIDKLVLDKQK
jgi:hypothetical protein